MQDLKVNEIDLHKNYLRNNVKTEKPFKVLTKHGVIVINSLELIDWIFEAQSKEDIGRIVKMIRIIKKRNTPIRALLETIAISLITIL